MAAPVLVFDLDGTLVETAPDLLDSLNHCLVQAGLSAVDHEQFRHYVGRGGRVMIERACSAQGTEPDEAMMERLLADFLDHYGASMPGKSHLFDGVLAAMDRFEAAGWTLAVCTNKYEALALRLLDGLGVKDRFAAIAGADSFTFRKPDPRHLTETIAAAQGDPSRSILVGDSQTDLETGKAANIPTVAVPFGYSDRPIADYDPDHLIGHFDELTVDLAESLLSKRPTQPRMTS